MPYFLLLTSYFLLLVGGLKSTMAAEIERTYGTDYSSINRYTFDYIWRYFHKTNKEGDGCNVQEEKEKEDEEEVEAEADEEEVGSGSDAVQSTPADEEIDEEAFDKDDDREDAQEEVVMQPL
jgi:hypothetical protein